MSFISRFLAPLARLRARYPRQFLLGTLALWLGVVVALLFGLPIIFTNAALCRPQFTPLADKEDPDTFAFHALNVRGQKIAAWYSPGRPSAPVVLLCHGHAVDHGQHREVHEFLRKGGYAILTLDFRAHGRSDGTYTSLGHQEWEDLDAVIREAEARGLISSTIPIAAYGRSMGAVTLINGSARLPRIGAFLLESPFAELRAVMANDARKLFMMPDCFILDLAFLYQEWRTGLSFFANRPVAAIAGCGSRPVLLIHDGKDVRADGEAFDALRAALAEADRKLVPADISSAGATFTPPLHRTSVYQHAHHVGAQWSEPERFQREFLEFLTAAGMGLSPAP